MGENSNHFWTDAGFVAAQVLVSLTVFVMVIAVLVFLLRQPLRKYKPVDLSVFQRLESFTNANRTDFMLMVTYLGNHKFLVPAHLLLLLYFVFISRHSWFSLRVMAIGISSLLLMLILKQLFRRKRPLSPLLNAVRGLSFPSGHAIMSTTFFGLLIYILYFMIPNNLLFCFLSGILVLLVFLIGFSRVYLRVHYASDVLAGFIIGLVWLLISLAVVKKVEKFAEQERAEVSLHDKDNSGGETGFPLLSVSSYCSPGGKAACSRERTGYYTTAFQEP